MRTKTIIVLLITLALALRSIEFSPSRLFLEIARDRNNRIEVIFDIGQSEFEEVRRVIDIISGKSSPDDEDAL
jgi:hypothetical protein